MDSDDQSNDLTKNGKDVQGKEKENTTDDNYDDNYDDFDETDNPFNEHRTPKNKTCLKSIIPDYHVEE
ncbi:hypothetical protein AC249_AIPGENE21848 [Exaiptasia diaphana]|nr:hypothetical protein AC249_AIPGENE21848 [Exaiptasia diaphana]